MMDLERRGSDCAGDSLTETLSREETLIGDPSVFDYEEQYPLKSDIKGLLRKIDRNLMPIICVLYLLSCLDHSNLGNARENGLLTDLHMNKRDDFNV